MPHTITSMKCAWGRYSTRCWSQWYHSPHWNQEYHDSCSEGSFEEFCTGNLIYFKSCLLGKIT